MKNKRMIAALLALTFALGSTSVLSVLAEATPSEADRAPGDGLSETSGPIHIDGAVTPNPDGTGSGDGQTPEPEATDPDAAKTPAPEDDPTTSTAPTETPHFARGYLYVDAGTIIYADAGRETHLGVMPTRQIVYARCVGIYENGCLYEIHFDTDRTAGTEKEQIGYFYTGRPQITSADEVVGERIAEGIGLVPYADLYYEDEPEPTDGPEDGEDDNDGEDAENNPSDDSASTNTNSVNIRREPTRSSDIVAQLTRGTKVTIVEAVTNAQGELWYKVTCEAGTGYIRADLIQQPETNTPAGDGEPAGDGTDTDGTTDDGTAAGSGTPEGTDDPDGTGNADGTTGTPENPNVIIDADQASDASSAISKDGGETEEEDVDFGGTDGTTDTDGTDDETDGTDGTDVETDPDADTDGTDDENETDAETDPDGETDGDTDTDETDAETDPDNDTDGTDDGNDPDGDTDGTTDADETDEEFDPDGDTDGTNDADETDEEFDPDGETDGTNDTDETETDEEFDPDGETNGTDDGNGLDEDTDGTDDPDVTSGEPEKLLDPDTTNPDRSICITASWGEKELEYGDTVTLSAELSGYEGLDIKVFWQCDKGEGYEDCPDTMGQSSFQFVVDETNAAWIWRAGVVITIEEPEPAQTYDETAEDAVEADGDAGETLAETTETTETTDEQA